MTDELRGEDSAPAALSTRVGQLWARVRAPGGMAKLWCFCSSPRGWGKAGREEGIANVLLGARKMGMVFKGF